MVVDIGAGQQFCTIIEISNRDSIICISLKTLGYDIKIGLYEAT